MAQTDFWSPVLNALITRQRMIESNQRQENAQKELEQQEKRIEQENRRIDQFEKQNERLLKQQEDAQKMRRLEAGIQLRGLADVLRGRWTGTLESPPTEAIPGADRVQQAPLMENILQSRGLVRDLPRSEVMVRGQEDKPISTSIPDFETGQPLLNIPIGTLRELSQQRDLIERNRTQEQRRQAEAAGQMELLKARSRAIGQMPLEEYKSYLRSGELDRKFEKDMAIQDSKNAAMLKGIALRNAGRAARTGADVVGMNLLGAASVVGNVFKDKIPSGGKELAQYYRAVNEAGKEFGIEKAIPIDNTMQTDFRSLQKVAHSLNKWVVFLDKLQPSENLSKEVVRGGFEALKGPFSELGILSEELNSDVSFFHKNKSGESRMSDFDAQTELAAFLRTGIRGTDGKRRIKHILDNIKTDRDSIAPGISDKQLNLVAPGLPGMIKELEKYIGEAKSGSKLTLSSDGKFAIVNGEQKPLNQEVNVSGKKYVFRNNNGKLQYREVK